MYASSGTSLEKIPQVSFAPEIALFGSVHVVKHNGHGHWGELGLLLLGDGPIVKKHYSRWKTRPPGNMLSRLKSIN
eukprot:3870276-Ditylum_brightwellii.AAC.1